MSGADRLPAAVPASWLAVLGLLTAVGPLAVEMYLSSFPAIADELGTSASALQLTLTAFMVGQLVGPLSDHWGRRSLMLAGNTLCVVASVACALAVSVEILTVCRLLQGLGGAAGVVLSRAVVADRAEGPASARIFSLMMIINGTAPVLAPLIGGAASNLIGWRGVFWILSGLATVMLVGAAAVLTETLPFERRVRGGFGALLRDGRQVLLDQAYPWYAMSFGFGFATIGAVRAGGRGGAVGGAGRGCDGCSHGGDADGVRAAGGVGTAVGEGTHQATVWVAPRRPTATGSTTREKGRRVRARALLPS